MLVAICVHVPSQQRCRQMLVERHHPTQTVIAITALQMVQENVTIGDVGYMYISENIDVVWPSGHQFTPFFLLWARIDVLYKLGP